MFQHRLLLLSALMTAIAAAASAAPSTDETFRAQPRFRHLTIEQGLSQSSVNCILQDRYGFVWLGTQDGLNRHDGYHFLVWKTAADDPMTFSDAYVTCLAEDEAGNLWVGSESSGFGRFNRTTQRFDILCTGPQDLAPDQDVDYGVLALAVAADGAVWIGTNAHGLVRHDPRTSAQRSWRQESGDLPSNEVTALRFDEQGRLWIGTARGVVRLDPGESRPRSPAATGDGIARLARARIAVLLRSADGGLWAGTEDGLYRWREDRGDFVRRLDVAQGVQSLAEDAEGVLWLGCLDHGVVRFDPRSDDQLHLQPDLSTSTSLQTGKIQTIMVDDGGVVWVGHDLGASLLDTHAKQFYHFKHEVGRAGSLSHNTVWSFSEDGDGGIWIATERGLNRFDPRSGLCETLSAAEDDPRRPSSDRMTVAYHDSGGRLWLGYAHGALNIRDPRTGRFRHVAQDSSGLAGAPSLRIYAIAEATDGVVWMATYDGLQSWHPDSGRFVGHWLASAGPYDLSGSTCKTLQIAPDGVLWVGTWGRGVVAIDPRTGSRRHFQHATDNRETITSDTILALLLDRSGHVWVGTGAGLARIDPVSGRVTRLTEKDGLPNNTIYSLAEDALGRIWAGTNFGLICLDPETLAFHHFQAKDGLQSNEFNMGAALADRRGRMYFGGINGLNVFYPERIQPNPYVPPVAITDLQINNQRVTVGAPNRGRDLLTRPICRTEDLELDHRDHVVSFTFTSLHYAAPEKNRYAYRLEGFDSDWTEAGGRTRATYTNLPPGSYVLRVRGSNSDGVWNEEGAALRIRVKPPFWQTAWFMILALVVGISAINGIIRYRTRLMKVRTQELEKRVNQRTADLTRANHYLQQEISERRRMEDALREARDQAEEATRTKSEFLANMSHEIRTPMNGVLGMTSVLLESKLDPVHREHLEVVYASARNLLNIINDILDFSKIETGKMELERTDFDLRSLVEEAAEILGPQAFQKGLEFALHIDHDVPTGLCGDPLRLRQVLVNLLSNAIKFTLRGRVEVRISLVERTPQKISLRFSISDTGVGIPPDRMGRLFESFSQVDTSTTRQYGGTGLGLAICKQLVELMNGEIGVESTVGEGTTFTYSLDLEPSSARPDEAPLGLTVLVIMPETTARRATVEILRYLGCRPLAPACEADPVQAAVLAVGQQPGVQAVLAGGWSGEAAIRQVPRKLQAALGAAAPPCLAVFNLGEGVDADELQAAGFAGWVTRPMRSAKLRDVLRQAQGDPAARPEGAQGPFTGTAPPAGRPDGDAGAAIPAAGSDQRAASNGGGLPLLLAEDNPVNQKVAVILLRKLGHEVEVVDNGAEALKALARRRYALVFMDVQMPVMDGYEAVRRIRAGSDGVIEPRVPIIALTAHAMKEDRQRCLDAGMDDYLTKPIDQKTLAALVEQHLEAGRPATIA